MSKVITCIDGSAITTDVSNAGIWAASRLNSPVFFLHVLEKDRQFNTDDFSGSIGLGARSALLEKLVALDQERNKIAIEMGSKMLNDASQQAKAMGCNAVEIQQRHGGFADTLLGMEGQARLFVMGRSGTDADSSSAGILGAHIEQVIKRLRKPVLIAREGFTEPESFMLAYDGRATTDKAIQQVVNSELFTGLTCHLVAVKNNVKNQHEKFEQAKETLAAAGIEVSATYLQGSIFEQLQQYSSQHAVDLIVMGASAGSRLRQIFLGSNTLKMLENAEQPVLIMR